MKKITEDQLMDYVSDVGEFDKEHRKGSSFYWTLSHKLSQDDVDYFATKKGIDASDLFNVIITRSGLWGGSYGREKDTCTYEKLEEYQELVPEVVIPEHYITKYKTSAFEPVFEE